MPEVYDNVIVGSGFGGAPVALRLAEHEQGGTVLVLEPAYRFQWYTGLNRIRGLISIPMEPSKTCLQLFPAKRGKVSVWRGVNGRIYVKKDQDCVK